MIKLKEGRNQETTETTEKNNEHTEIYISF